MILDAMHAFTPATASERSSAGTANQLAPFRVARARQAAKIQEIKLTLNAMGYRGLGKKAAVLGLPRSTVWSILKANHKASGLSAATINRMLAEPDLPAPVRRVILEYIDKKRAGSYGDNQTQLRRFSARLSVTRRQNCQEARL